MDGQSGSSIIIIGAGIAGLSAGCYARMNGFSTRIFEMHSLPGGMVTSWKRMGYTFDGCIHWLAGTRPDTTMHKVWQELGALQNQNIIQHDLFRQIVMGDRCLNVYIDPDRLEAEMLRISPQDRAVIKEFTGSIRFFAGFQPPLDRFNMSPGELLRALPYFTGILKYQRVTIGEFATRFRDPFLRQAFLNIFPLPAAAMFIAILTLALFHDGNNGYPEGGSLEFAKTIERRYLELGGEIQYRAKVVKILVEQDRAVGVRLVDGTEHRADWVISAADGHTTLFEMLGEEFVDAETKRYYTDFPLFQPLVYVSLGINRDFSGEPHIVTQILEREIDFAGEKHGILGWFHYAYDSTLAPKGKTVVAAMIETNFEFWENMAANATDYEAAKQQAAERIIDLLEQRYPGIRSQIEVIDVATPQTWKRYTGVWRGSYEGWLPTKEATATKMKKTLPGLANFYLCGQWVEPGGGVPVAAISGRNVIQTICRQERRKFLHAAP